VGAHGSGSPAFSEGGAAPHRAMWARRCGSPPRWPSWARIIIQSFMSGTVGLVVYQFMHSLSEANLDLARNESNNVTCVTEWLKRNDAADWYSPTVWKKWVQYMNDTDTYVIEHACHPAKPIAASCSDAAIPARYVQGSLGYPMGNGEGPNFSNDVLHVYAYLFLMLGIGNLVGFLVHDWALIHVVNKNFVLDWTGLIQGFPGLLNIWSLTGIHAYKQFFKAPGRKRKWSAFACGILVFPCFFAWSTVIFLIVLTPAIVMLFFWHPVRLSRFWIFCLLLATTIYGFVLFIHQIVFLSDLRWRPRYAVTWKVAATGGPSECECGCSYYMAPESIWRLAFIGVGVMIRSILAALRCLKGLRRSQWANLMSVMFPVPVSAYAVEWTTPSGEAIQNRKPGEPVQGEQAFDPFALMDEQPESRYTTVTLRPEFAYSVDDAGRWKPLGLSRSFDGPKLPELKKGEMLWQPTEYIGCCGFPCMTGGYQAVINTDSEDEEEVAAQDHAEEIGQRHVRVVDPVEASSTSPVTRKGTGTRSGPEANSTSPVTRKYTGGSTGTAIRSNSTFTFDSASALPTRTGCPKPCRFKALAIRRKNAKETAAATYAEVPRAEGAGCRAPEPQPEIVLPSSQEAVDARHQGKDQGRHLPSSPQRSQHSRSADADSCRAHRGDEHLEASSTCETETQLTPVAVGAAPKLEELIQEGGLGNALGLPDTNVNGLNHSPLAPIDDTCIGKERNVVEECGCLPLPQCLGTRL